jgi:Protein of unknown function (DUF1569)
MAKTLANTADREEIQRRLTTLTPESTRAWGTMSIGGMLCHLDDSYQLALGERAGELVQLPVPRGVLKYLALRLPIEWKRNMGTMPAVKQGSGGTAPGAFVEDRARLLATVARFCTCPTLAEARHPFFDRMSTDDWLRWGWLHADHHLRQFSA